MSVKLSDIIRTIEKDFPPSLGMDWDNPGLLVGRAEKDVKKVLIALDPDGIHVREAVENRVDLLLTHHPMIFGSIRHVSTRDALGTYIIDLIENRISCYAMHTNFDIAEGGMGDLAASMMGAGDRLPLEVTADTGTKKLGVGFVYDLPEGETMSARELALFIKDTFSLGKVWFYDAGRMIRRIACCPGSGRGMEEAVLSSGADAFVTGDTGHHDGLAFKDAGISLIDAGHYGIEHIFVDWGADYLHRHYPDLEILKGAADERIFV